MTLALSGRRFVWWLLALGVAGGVAFGVGGSRVALAVACVAALALVEVSMRLLTVATGPAARRQPDPGSCAACGYSLAGLPAGSVCPECGVRSDPSEGATPSQRRGDFHE